MASRSPVRAKGGGAIEYRKLSEKEVSVLKNKLRGFQRSGSDYKFARLGLLMQLERSASRPGRYEYFAALHDHGGIELAPGLHVVGIASNLRSEGWVQSGLTLRVAGTSPEPGFMKKLFLYKILHAFHEHSVESIGGTYNESSAKWFKGPGKARLRGTELVVDEGELTRKNFTFKRTGEGLETLLELVSRRE